METLPEDDLLLRQREKLNAHAAWIYEQQHKPHTPSPPTHDDPNAQLALGPPTPMGVTASDHLGRRDLCSPPPTRRVTRSECADDAHFFTPRGGSVRGVQERSALWQMRRDRRLAAQRAQRGEEDVWCTFRPHINAFTPPTPSETAPLGVEEFVRRQQRARRMARERAERGRADGSKWTGAQTMAEPFLFARRPPPAEIASLRRPVQSAPGEMAHVLGTGEAESAPRVSLEALAAAEGIALPPPGAFSSWTVMQCLETTP